MCSLEGAWVVLELQVTEDGSFDAVPILKHRSSKQNQQPSSFVAFFLAGG